MEEFLVLLLQFLAELVMNIVSSGLDWPTSTSDRSDQHSRLWVRSGWLFLGGVLGYASVWILPHTILGHAWLRLINMGLSPVIAGFLSRQFASRFGDEAAIPRNHFWNAFCCSLGFVLMRFAYASRG